MQIDFIFPYVAALMLALGSQGLFQHEFSWLWFIIFILIGIGAFPLASRLAPFFGAILIGLLAVLSLAATDIESLASMPALGWILAVTSASLVNFELDQGRPGWPGLMCGFIVTLMGSALFGAIYIVLPLMVLLAISLYSVNKDIIFPRSVAKIMLFVVLVSPWALKYGPMLRKVVQDTFPFLSF